VIDEEVTRILDEQAVRATAEIAARRPQLDALATALLDHETLDAPDIERIVTQAADAQMPCDDWAGVHEGVGAAALSGGS
jgi:ATP-dependent Zn protease